MRAGRREEEGHDEDVAVVFGCALRSSEAWAVDEKYRARHWPYSRTRDAEYCFGMGRYGVRTWYRRSFQPQAMYGYVMCTVWSYLFFRPRAFNVGPRPTSLT